MGWPVEADGYRCPSCETVSVTDRLRVEPLTPTAAGLSLLSIAWEHADGSATRRWTDTWSQSIGRPQTFGRLVAEQGTLIRAARFAIWAELIWLIPYAGLALLIAGVVAIATQQADNPLLVAAWFIASFAFTAAFTPMFMLLAVALPGHVVLRLTGPVQGGLKRTIVACAYAQGPGVFNGIPCLGGYVAPLWCLINAIFILRAAQDVSGSRSALACLAGPVILLVAFIALYLTLVLRL